jgi:hypothetical protein
MRAVVLRNPDVPTGAELAPHHRAEPIGTAFLGADRPCGTPRRVQRQRTT